MDLIGEFRLNDVDNCNEIYCLAFHELRQLKGQLFFSLRVAVPSPSPPPQVKRRRGNVYVNLTLIVFRDVTLAKKYTMTFYWLTPFVDSFVNSDWLELIIYFHTNEYSTIVQMIVKDDRGKAIA